MIKLLFLPRLFFLSEGLVDKLFRFSNEFEGANRFLWEIFASDSARMLLGCLKSDVVVLVMFFEVRHAQCITFDIGLQLSCEVARDAFYNAK